MGAGLEDWIQIDRVHPQRLEVGELLLQALQVSAVMSIKDEVFVEGLAVFPFPRTGLVPREGPRTNWVMVVEGRSVTEPLHHDLVPNGILGPIGRADVGGGGLVELVHIWMSHSEYSVLEHKSVLVAFSIGGERGGPTVEQVRTALEPQVLGVAIIEDDPHLFDITAQRLGRDLELLVAEGLQIAPVGWIVPECGADNGAVTDFGLVGV